MTFSRIAPALASALLLCACSKEDPNLTVSQQLADQVLLPAYSQWAEANQTLAKTSAAFCAEQSSLEQTRTQYLAAQNQWAALQPLLVGPLSEGNRAWQVQFWPDKKDLVARQVEILLKRTPSLTEADLTKASVAVKGLSAYEYVLFDERIDLNDAAQKSRYCPLLVAIADYQSTLASQVLSEWQADQGMQQRLKAFPNSQYSESSEAIAELLRIQVNAIDGLKKKLGAPMGRQTKGIIQPFQAEAWRSNASLSTLRAAVGSAKALWQGQNQGVGLSHLVPKEHDQIIGKIDQAFADLEQRLDAQTQPLSVLLNDEQGRQALDDIYQSLNTVHRLHEGELAQALGITLGFNAHDGD